MRKAMASAFARTAAVGLAVCVLLGLTGWLAYGWLGREKQAPVGKAGTRPHLRLTLNSISGGGEGSILLEGVIRRAGGLPAVGAAKVSLRNAVRAAQLSAERGMRVVPDGFLLTDDLSPQTQRVGALGVRIQAGANYSNLRVALDAANNEFFDLPDGAVLQYTIDTEISCTSTAWVGTRYVPVLGEGTAVFSRRNE